VSWRTALRAVASAFFGVKRGAEVEQDIKLPFWQLIVIALALAALFIALLVTIVRIVV
jgi:hypothetical protein